MANRLTYADAVRLLGGRSPGLAAADLALGGALLTGSVAGVPGVLGLFDAKVELVRVGHTLLTGLDDRVRGLGRLDRTVRLHAAHAVIVVTAYFEEFDLPDADLSRDDQLRLAGAGAEADGWIDGLLGAQLPTPAADTPYEVLLRQLDGWYADLSLRFTEFLTGLAVWDSLHDTARTRIVTTLRDRLPAAALRRYQILHRQLAAEVVEFRLWTRALDDQATRDGVRAVTRGLQELESLLRNDAGRPERHRAALAAWYRAELDEPILAGEGLPPGLRMPTLGEIYIDPVFRVRPGGPGDQPAAEDWWSETEPWDDLPAFLAGYLTGPTATTAPLLVLGQPGAGKSALTRVVAARLPAADFVPVRVPLREAPADASLQDQIEYALRAATGDAMTWPALVAGDEGGALPVLLLDGFDELLQATGVSRSDFLEQAAAFQRREAVQRRPVAVIVTSRSAVADRARLPPHSTVLRLEPFTPAQVARWLDIWNRANAPALTARGLTALPAAVADWFPDLAGQPLLLLMLALYDAEANDVQTMAGEQFDAAQLYERLLRSYAEREIRKSADTTTEVLVEAELQRLSIAAFAMFNRGRQWVTATELDTDLTALGVATGRPAVDGFRAPLSGGEELLGRFFFIQNAQAVREGRRLQTYEFLHATFGEFLIVRLVVRILEVMLARQAVVGLAIRPAAAADDGLLPTLLSYAPLTDRAAVLQFLKSVMARTADVDRFGALCERAFRAAAETAEIPLTAYRPRQLTAADRQAICAFNLLLLTLAGGPVTAGRLFPGSDDPVNVWRCWMERWQATAGDDSWGTFVNVVTSARGWAADRRELTLRMHDGPHAPPVPGPVDAFWTHGMVPGSPGRGYLGFRFGDEQDVRRTYGLRCHPMDDVVMHAVEPILDAVGPALCAFGPITAEDCPSVAHMLAATWLATADSLAATYQRAVYVITRSWAPADREPSPGYGAAAAEATLVFLRLLSRDAGRLPPGDVADWIRDIRLSQYTRTEHHPWILDVLITAALADPSVIDIDLDLRELCRTMRRIPRWDGTLAIRVWTGFHLLHMDREAEQLFGDRETFLADPVVADALRRDPRLALQVGALIR
ncbi:NACHT domain-containing protein [Actinoplanes utahensis]|uniref:NACHT domain-containing protein n=1 Tax=Actinoplanes utahensis TaxID=1869 RepID=UPI000A7CB4FA|nr:hypothetical protein [Actinoplanes utahensis]